MRGVKIDTFELYNVRIKIKVKVKEVDLPSAIL